MSDSQVDNGMRTQMAFFRLTKDEKALLKNMSKKHDRTVSDFIRIIFRREAIKEEMITEDSNLFLRIKE